MKKHPLVRTMFGALAALVAVAGARAGPGDLVFTADEAGSTISRLDLASGEVIRVAVPIAPHNVQLSVDGRWLYAVGAEPAGPEGHAHSGGRGRLIVFRAVALDLGPVASIDVGPHPAHVVADAADAFAYVTEASSDKVVAVDLAAGTVADRIATGRYPHGLRLSPDGGELYVANVRGNSVSVVSTTRRREVARIPVGRMPVQVAFAPDGGRVYVSLKGDNKVAAIDRAQRRVVARWPTGRGPVQVHVTPDGGQLWVANQGSDSRPDDRVAMLLLPRGGRPRLLVTGRGAHGVAVAPDGARVFVTNILDDSLSIIDPVGFAVLSTVKVGRGPNGVTAGRPAE